MKQQIEVIPRVNTWTELRTQCPINIDTIVTHGKSYKYLTGINITPYNINKAKRAIIQARGQLDMMIASLSRALYDRQILRNKVDEVLQLWLMENINRILKDLDDKQTHLIIKYDDVDLRVVGVARIVAYKTDMDVIAKAVIFETIVEATYEYNNFKETDIHKREPRTFLYILFHMLQVSLFAIGGAARTANTSGSSVSAKKGVMSYYPSSWQTMMTYEGQKSIANIHESQTGEKIDLPIPQEIEDFEDDFGEEEYS